MLAAQLAGISTNSFSSVVGRKLGLLTATEFSRLAGVHSGRTAALRSSFQLHRVLFFEGGRNIALYSPVDAREVGRCRKNRLAAQTFASTTGLGIDAVELLVGDKFLSLDDDPLIQAIWPVPHLDRAMALDLGERITCKLKPYPAPDDAIKLSEALRGCPADDKPWCLIVEALLAGHISL